MAKCDATAHASTGLASVFESSFLESLKPKADSSLSIFSSNKQIRQNIIKATQVQNLPSKAFEGFTGAFNRAHEPHDKGKEYHDKNSNFLLTEKMDKAARTDKAGKNTHKEEASKASARDQDSYLEVLRDVSTQDDDDLKEQDPYLEVLRDVSTQDDEELKDIQEWGIKIQDTNARAAGSTRNDVRHISHSTKVHVRNKTTNVSLLVFGDSWGAGGPKNGPSWRIVQDMFDKRGIGATVRNSTKGGMKACETAADPLSLATEAERHFPDGGPDFVWYSLGGNDVDNNTMWNCTINAQSLDDYVACIKTQMKDVIDCTTTLFKKLWAKFPKTKVMQCGYDIPCMDGGCYQDFAMGVFPYCGHSVTCYNTMMVALQPMLMGKLSAAYPNSYTGINLLGTVQKAGGVTGAAVGSPVMDVGSPCSLMSTCAHPTYGKAGATAIGDAFWDLYFKGKVLSSLPA